MITPIFRIEQDHDNLYVIVRVNNLRTLSENVEIFHQNNEFIFYGKPYYLRLELPGEVISSDSIIMSNDDDDENLDELKKFTFNYDSETNELKIPVAKKNPGEHFENLEMIGQLLAKPKTKPGKRLIQVLQSNYQNSDDDEEDEEFDWTIEQTISVEQDEIRLSQHPYGFANSLTNIVNNDSEMNELFDIKNPGEKTIAQRRIERLQKEANDFNEEHYLANLYEDDSLIDSIMELSAPWDDWHSSTILTDQDTDGIIDHHIPKREFIRYDSVTKKALILGIFDILYGYCYDLRTNDFEHTVESPWAIIKLSATLSCFEFWVPLNDQQKIMLDDSVLEKNDMPKYMLINCIRRSLIYPLYRHWRLSIKVANDVIKIMSIGSNAILKCLLGKFYK
ncbi:SHQ1-like protein [Euroglyphus maynei]|uniref:Protein SHQ1 homolog n=1 Tax=Euroglyphus maynei TaxID=6958 RepID=A0A1Y3BG81_EURMA|nr:SHQ1-like protein [Euroglyphus maynei]